MQPSMPAVTWSFAMATSRLADWCMTEIPSWISTLFRYALRKLRRSHRKLPCKVGLRMPSTVVAKAAKHLAAGIASTCLTSLNSIITVEAVIPDKPMRRANSSGFGVTTRSLGLAFRATNTARNGCSTPGIGYGQRTRMAFWKCRVDARRLPQKCVGILPTNRVTPARPDAETRQLFARFGRTIPLRSTNRVLEPNSKITSLELMSWFQEDFLRIMSLSQAKPSTHVSSDTKRNFCGAGDAHGRHFRRTREWVSAAE